MVCRISTPFYFLRRWCHTQKKMIGVQINILSGYLDTYDYISHNHLAKENCANRVNKTKTLSYDMQCGADLPERDAEVSELPLNSKSVNHAALRLQLSIDPHHLPQAGRCKSFEEKYSAIARQSCIRGSLSDSGQILEHENVIPSFQKAQISSKCDPAGW